VRGNADFVTQSRLALAALERGNRLRKQESAHPQSETSLWSAPATVLATVHTGMSSSLLWDTLGQLT
jgi:hypothetical protein